MDVFPEKKKEIESLNNRIDVKPVMDVITSVVQFLMTKSIHESKKQDVYNQTILGNVTFYIAYNEISKEAKLHFDKHPKGWNIKEIMDDLLNAEADMMAEKGAYEDILDNPFTY